jgi:ubiquinone/menaquinone biosynthesis C-methylase UbiE
LCGVKDATSFYQASALALPFEECAFDAAYMCHVGMNIQDKMGVFKQVYRVLKQDGLFCVFDIMGHDSDSLDYPLPWAKDRTTSFLCAPSEYKSLLKDLGFTIVHEENKNDFALTSLKKMIEASVSDRIDDRQNMSEKLDHLYEAVSHNYLAPHLILARKT